LSIPTLVGLATRLSLKLLFDLRTRGFVSLDYSKFTFSPIQLTLKYNTLDRRCQVKIGLFLVALSFWNLC